jgi:hypothetical protein
MKDINLLCGIDNKILAKPLKNSAALNEVYGSVAIYPPGSECPNFYYSLFSCLRDDGFWEYCTKFSSGIINIRKAKHRGQCNTEPEQVDSDNLKEYFAELYKNSVWPIGKDVANMIEHLESLYRHKLELNSDHADNIMDKLENIFTITQEELCYLFPGVYYNFVCRNFNNESESMMRAAKITEAELYRKPHLKAYYGFPHYKEHKIQKIQKEIQGYDANIDNLSKYKKEVEEEGWNWSNNNPQVSNAKQEYNQLLNQKQFAANDLRNLEANNTLRNMRNMAYTVPNGVYNKINGTWVPRASTRKKSPKK